MKTMIKKSKFRSGQSLVEMGISMIVLLLLLAGAINFGMAYFDYVAIRDAAQEGALYGSVTPWNTGTNSNNTTGIDDRVRDASSAPINLHDVGVGVAISSYTACPGNPITVTVTYDSPIIMPIVGVFSDSIPLQASATSTILTSTNPGCE